MKFTITVPAEHHDTIMAALDSLGHVSLNRENKTGIIRDESGAEFAFAHIGENDVEVTVIENPKDESESQLRARFEADIQTILASA